MNCRNCDAETNNGLALCERCRAAASIYLEYIPIYFRNLARWKPGRAGSRPVPGSREPTQPALAPPDRISRALDDAESALNMWGVKLAAHRGTPPTADTETAQIEALCRWFSQHLTTIATLDWCGDFMRPKQRDQSDCRSIHYHEGKLRRLTAQVAPGWYAGLCRNCQEPTRVVPGLTWVTCAGCGATTYARDHLDVVLSEARPWVAPPLELAKAVVALTDKEASVARLHKRVSKWGERGVIDVHRREDAEGDPIGPKCYMLGDVLDRLEREGPTLKVV